MSGRAATAQTTVAAPLPITRGGPSLGFQRQCACGGSAGLTGACQDCQKKKLLGKPLQTKLRINEPGDQYEQEADRVAGQVMRMPDTDLSGPRSSSRSPLVQRQATGGGTGVMEAPPIVYQVLSSPGQPLDAETRAFFEPRFGHDFSQVRVHHDTQAEESARAIDAEAYTNGEHIALEPSKFMPSSYSGRKLLAHELAHVIQQRSCEPNGYEQTLSTQRSGPVIQRKLKDIKDYTGVIRASTSLSEAERNQLGWSEARACKDPNPPADRMSFEKHCPVVLAPNTEVKVMQEAVSGSWLFVEHPPAAALGGQRYGYVPSAFIEAVRPVRKENDPTGPEFTQQGWAAVNKLGIVYKESGVNLRDKSSTAGSPLARLPQNTKVHILSHNPQSHWLAVSVVGDAFDKDCNRYSHLGKFGYVSDDYVWWKTPLPDADAILYSVQSKDALSKVVQSHCQYKTYNIKVGDDARSLAMAVYIASQDNPETKRGVKINEKKFKKAQEDFDLVERIDPYRGGTQDLFDSVELVAGERIWLPGISYIEQLKQADIIPSRPDWMNTAIEVGKGIGGFSVGVVEGIVQSIVDVFVGIYDIVSGIIKGMVSLVNGEALKAAADIIAVIKEMSLEDVKQLGAEFLKAIGGLIVKSIDDFIYRFWKDPDPYKKWHFRGLIVGYILAEVLMAIFTAAIANVVKWVGKLGKVGGKLAKLIEKLLTKLEKLVPERKKPKKDSDKPDSSDSGEKATQLPFALGAARTIAETHDKKDSSIPVVIASLAPLKKKYRWIKKFSAKRKPQAGHYEILMHASTHTIDDNYTTEIELKDEDIEDITPTQVKAIWATKDWGKYTKSGRKIGIVDGPDGPQAWYIRTGGGGAAGPGGPAAGEAAQFHGWAKLEEINEFNKNLIPSGKQVDWFIKPKGGRHGKLGTADAEINSQKSQFLASQTPASSSQTIPDIQWGNDYLKQNGVQIGGGYQVGEVVVLNGVHYKITQLPGI